MNDLLETRQVVDGYDKKTLHTIRPFTLEDIRAMGTSHSSEFHFIDRHGNLRRCRPNGKLKTWKRDPLRFERTFMYGMYESFRLTTEQMLTDLVVKL
jgi:hypothetical protein